MCANSVPRRDWRDYFIMATLMSGLSYGLYFIAKVGDIEIIFSSHDWPLTLGLSSVTSYL